MSVTGVRAGGERACTTVGVWGVSRIGAGAGGGKAWTVGVLGVFRMGVGVRSERACTVGVWGVSQIGAEAGCAGACTVEVWGVSGRGDWVGVVEFGVVVWEVWFDWYWREVKRRWKRKEEEIAGMHRLWLIHQPPHLATPPNRTFQS